MGFRNKNIVLAISMLVFAVMQLPLFAQNTQNPKRNNKAQVIRAEHFDLSIPLRDMQPAPRKAGIRKVVPNRPLPKKPSDTLGPVTAGELDSVMQSFEGPTLMAPTSGSSFNGVGDGFTGPQGTHDVNVAPPDPVHDVGPNHIVQAVNSNFAILNKSGTVLYGPVALNTLWSGFGGRCQSDNDGDPTINYDQMADRWVIMQFAVSGTPYTQCVAVSQTSDPLGAYHRYAYTFTDFNDYPKVGVWPDGYYVTYNMFTDVSGYGNVCVLDRSKLLAGQANSQRCHSTGSNMGLLPSDMDGVTQPAAGSPNYVFNFDDAGNRLQMWKFTVNWAVPSSSLTGPTNIAVAAFSESCVSATRGACVPQSGTTSKLEALADRLMNRVAYRRFAAHESIVLAHAVGGDTAAQIRWYELRSPNATPTIFQSGTYAPNTNWRWMPSIAMDKTGNIGVGYSISSSSMSPDIYYTGRESTDALGTLGTETTMLSGVTRGSQVGTYGNPPQPLQRWGDYAALVLDPSDDCTFWFTSEYLPANGIFNWRTRIASFTFNSCTAGGSDTVAPTTSITSPANGATVSGTITISANASDNVGVTNVEFYRGATLIGSDATSPYSVSWNTTGVTNGSYSLTSRAYDAAGNNASSTAVNVTVNNITDTTPPTTSITSPANGATVSGSVTVTANAADNIGVTNVEFYRGATLIGSDATSPYSVSWNTTLVTNGTYSLTSRAFDAAGNNTTSTAVSVTVNNIAGPPALMASYDATLKAPLCIAGGKSCDTGASIINGRGTITNGNETNRPNTIGGTCLDGNAGTYHADESIDRLVVATNDSTAFAGGKTVTVSATVWCYTSSPTSDSLDLYYTSNAASPTWTLIGTQTCTAGGAQTLTRTYTLPSTGTQHAVRANYRYQGSAGSCTTGTYDDHDDLVFGVSQASDVTAPTTSITSPANGATVSGAITISANASDNVGVTKVEFYRGGTTLIGTDTTSPYSVSWDTTGVTNGSYTLTSKAYDAANNIGTSTGVAVTVNNVSVPDLTATYNSTYKAPACASGGKSCDSGASLINGRGTMINGNETNRPNTINNSCADANSGTYHVDESIDRLKVATSDGTALAAGKSITVTVTAWCYDSTDRLDLYRTATIPGTGSPTWTLIGTQSCTAAGVRTFTATYTLPAGATQAIRGNFRYGGTAGTCSTGNYNDRDDLVFGVQ